MEWLLLVAGMLLGSVLGVFIMCLCIVAGEESRQAERREACEKKRQSM